jgi:hypothetical protein
LRDPQLPCAHLLQRSDAARLLAPPFAGSRTGSTQPGADSGTWGVANIVRFHRPTGCLASTTNAKADACAP